MADAGITLQAGKCHLGYQSLTVLGHMVDRLGLSTTSQEAESVKAMPAPRTLSKLEHFIGMTNWHCHLIPYYAQRVKALQKLKTRLNRELSRSSYEKRDKSAEQLVEGFSLSRSNGSAPIISRQPLTKQERQSSASRKIVVMVTEEMAAFLDLQATLASKVCIRHYNPDKKVYILSNASRRIRVRSHCLPRD